MYLDDKINEYEYSYKTVTTSYAIVDVFNFALSSKLPEGFPTTTCEEYEIANGTFHELNGEDRNQGINHIPNKIRSHSVRIALKNEGKVKPDL